MPMVPYVKSPKMGHGDCNFGRHKTAKALDVSVPASSTRALMRWSNAGSPLPLVELGLGIGSTGIQSQSSPKQVPERKFGSKRHVVSDEASVPNEGIVLINPTSVFCATASGLRRTSAAFALICLNVRLSSPPFNQLRR